MRIEHFGVTFTTKRTCSEGDEGWEALELHQSGVTATTCVAKAVFWDAIGQITFSMLTDELPLYVVESFTAEVRETLYGGLTNAGDV